MEGNWVGLVIAIVIGCIWASAGVKLIRTNGAPIVPKVFPELKGRKVTAIGGVCVFFGVMSVVGGLITFFTGFQP